ncbi:MAG: type III pantothenate kinase [Phycisphaerae bacterium]
MSDSEPNSLCDPRASASLLLLEIGNTHVCTATSVDGRIHTNERFGHDQVGQVVGCAEEAWRSLPEDRMRAISACSVVPSVLADVRREVSNRLDQPVMVVSEDLHRPLSLAVEEPNRVGVDRVCSAAAAYDTFQHACVVASFGTAITIDCVNDEGVFMGGAILPGLEAQAQALHERTAQLPQVPIRSPAAVFGTTTEEAIRTGVLIGVAGALREITERYATELRVWPDVVATGGNVELIAQHTDIIDRLVPDLCLLGVALAYRKHFSPFGEDET